jgi:hypothetical protein
MVEGLSEKSASPGMTGLSGELLGTAAASVAGFTPFVLAGAAGPAFWQAEPSRAASAIAVAEKCLNAKRIGGSPLGTFIRPTNGEKICEALSDECRRTFQINRADHTGTASGSPAFVECHIADCESQSQLD